MFSGVGEQSLCGLAMEAIERLLKSGVLEAGIQHLKSSRQTFLLVDDSTAEDDYEYEHDEIYASEEQSP